MSSWIKLQKTMWPDVLMYGKICDGYWSFFDVTDESHIPVGPHYQTKELLITDMRRYAKEAYGLDY